MLPSVQEMEAYIRAEAAANGIDPDTAVRVARSEGLAPGVWQATGNLAYGRERSYGPFQLHVAPQGYRGGMGNDFIRATGLDPADPRNWKQGVSFALNQASKVGWSPWFGAKKIGVTGKMGIGGRPVNYQPPAPVREDRGAPFNNGLGTAAPPAQGAPAASAGGYDMMPFMGEAPSRSESSLGNLLANMAQPRRVQAPVQQDMPAAEPDYAAWLGELAKRNAPQPGAPQPSYGAPALPSLDTILRDV